MINESPRHEEDMLGKILYYRADNAHFIDSLAVEDFTVPRHRALFTAMQTVRRREGAAAAFGGDLTPTNVAAVLSPGDPNARAELIDLVLSMPSGKGGENLSRYLRELSGVREAQALRGADYVERAAGLADACALIRAEVDRIEARRRPADGKTLDQLTDEVFLAMERRHKGEVEAVINTGVRAIDEMLHGLRPGALCIVAARTGFGKSALLTTIFGNIMRESKGRVMLFSCEMSQQEVMERIIAAAGRLTIDMVRYGPKRDSEWARYSDTCAMLRRAADRGRVIDTAGSLADIQAISKADHATTPIDVVMVDYLQMVPGTAKRNSNREQEVAEVARGLKRLAMDLKCVVLAASQFNRDNDKASRPPRLSDLRESGEIEQSADVVLALHRETQDEKANEIEDTYAMVLKGRSIARDTRQILFHGAQCRFE